MRGLDGYLDEIVRELSAAIGGDLVAVYLHGSAAMGEFVPSRSDVDVLVVARDGLTAATKEAAADAMHHTGIPCPGAGGLELSIVTRASARTPADRPRFELHVATQDGTTDPGTGDAGDADLVAHFAMTRAHGIALAGPPAAHVIAPVERPRLLRAFADDLAWAIDHGLTGYAVLNACRATRFARDGTLFSKPAGGRWALVHGVGDSEVVAAALDRQAGADRAIDAEAASRLAAAARTELLREADAPPS
jgi:hypothetical protein